MSSGSKSFRPSSSALQMASAFLRVVVQLFCLLTSSGINTKKGVCVRVPFLSGISKNGWGSPEHFHQGTYENQAWIIAALEASYQHSLGRWEAVVIFINILLHIRHNEFVDGQACASNSAIRLRLSVNQVSLTYRSPK